jgi:hypothetical protein
MNSEAISFGHRIHLSGELWQLRPKSEIETGNLPQSPGHKRFEKISTSHFGYASIFSIRSCSNIFRHLAGLNFGIRDKRKGVWIESRLDGVSACGKQEIANQPISSFKFRNASRTCAAFS